MNPLSCIDPSLFRKGMQVEPKYVDQLLLDGLKKSGQGHCKVCYHIVPLGEMKTDRVCDRCQFTPPKCDSCGKECPGPMQLHTHITKGKTTEECASCLGLP